MDKIVSEKRWRDREIKDAVADGLEDLRQAIGIPDTWRLSLLARDPENAKREFLITQDSMPEILRALSRAMERDEVF